MFSLFFPLLTHHYSLFSNIYFFMVYSFFQFLVCYCYRLTVVWQIIGIPFFFFDFFVIIFICIFGLNRVNPVGDIFFLFCCCSSCYSFLFFYLYIVFKCYWCLVSVIVCSLLLMFVVISLLHIIYWRWCCFCFDINEWLR